MPTRDVTSDAANTDKATPTSSDKLMVVDVATNPDSLKESTIPQVLAVYDTQTATMTNKTLTTPTIASFTNATHGHTTAATGGAITRGYTVLLYHDIFSPADATTYYFGVPHLAAGTTADIRRRYIPTAGTITSANINITNSGGVTGSSENSTLYIRLNNTTDTQLSAAVQMNVASPNSYFYNITGLSIAVAVNDYIEGKWVAATFATNPTNIMAEVQLYITT